MKKFECPCCHEESITRLQKAFAGNLKSKGKVCPNCGKHIVNGKSSTIFSAVIYCVCIAIIAASTFFDLTANQYIPLILSMIILPFIATKIFDGFISKELDQTWRTNV